MWKNIVERGRPQMTIWSKRTACWIPEATNIHSEYVILLVFPLQQWLHERASILRYSTMPVLWNVKWQHGGLVKNSFWFQFCGDSQLMESGMLNSTRRLCIYVTIIYQFRLRPTNLTGEKYVLKEYILRLGEKRNSYRFLVGKPELKRPLWRPKT